MKEGISMTIHKLKSYRKLDSSSQNSVDKAITKLKCRYEQYAKQNAAVSDILGDSVIAHEVIDGNYLVFKCCTREVQVRLLYQIFNNKINVIDYYIKNDTNCNTSNHGKEVRYLEHFKDTVRSIKTKKGEVFHERSYC
jgi:hypothetical protein